jgi:hypothetical protein
MGAVFSGREAVGTIDNERGKQMTATTKTCQDCGVQIAVLQLGDFCGSCLLAWADSISNTTEGFTSLEVKS